MFPASPASVMPNSVWSPLETLKPANSITASLGIGMQAARRHQQEDPGQAGVVDDVDAEVDDRAGQVCVEDCVRQQENP